MKHTDCFFCAQCDTEKHRKHPLTFVDMDRGKDIGKGIEDAVFKFCDYECAITWLKEHKIK